MREPGSRPPSLALSVSTSALAPALAAILTNPADVAKTRLNMMLELQPGSVRVSVLECLRQIHAAEGVAGLQRGLSFVLVRESSKNAFRLGLFEPVLVLLQPDPGTKPSMQARFAAGVRSVSLRWVVKSTAAPAMETFFASKR